MDALDRILAASDVVAVLGRDVPVRLKNISAAGCLLESSSRLECSTAGLIRVTVAGEVYEDLIRIRWCRVCEGASPLYHMGAEFLWTSTPGERSLRRIAARAQVGERVRLEVLERGASWIPKGEVS